MTFQGGNHYNCNFFGHIEVLDVYLSTGGGGSHSNGRNRFMKNVGCYLEALWPGRLLRACLVAKQGIFSLYQGVIQQLPPLLCS